jgi:hypothetical protein
MNSEPNSEDNTPDGNLKADTEGSPPDVNFDVAELLRKDGSQSEFDDFLRDQAEQLNDDSTENFGELDDSVVSKGRVGVLPPELGEEPLQPGELAFSLDVSEFRQVVRTLNVLLRNKPAHHRRCRITIQDDRIIWHANQANAFIEYVTWGRVSDHSSTGPTIFIVAINDLAAAAAATKTTATFRISSQKIRFSAELFRRPILTFSPQKFISHTDTLLADIRLDDTRPQVATRALSDALGFVGPLASKDDAANNLNLIQIRDGSAIAGRQSAVAIVRTGALDGLAFAFRPHFLRPLLEALKLLGSVRIQHNEKLCIIRNDQMTFGFELVPWQFPRIPEISCTDKILVPLPSLKGALSRASEMFGSEAVLVLKSDERGNSPLRLEVRHKSMHPARRFKRRMDVYREGPHEGPITLTLDGPYLHHALKRFSDANAQLEFSEKPMLYLESETEDAKYSIILHAEIAL